MKYQFAHMPSMDLVTSKYSDFFAGSPLKISLIISGNPNGYPCIATAIAKNLLVGSVAEIGNAG